MRKALVSATLALSLFTIAPAAAKPAKTAKPSQAKTETVNNKNSNVVLATVGGENITLAELEKAFGKNSFGKSGKLSETTRDSVMDFLNLYIRYKLKVKDALARGFDRDSSVLAEIAENRRVLAESFFFEKELTDRELDKMAERRKTEYKIAYILTTFQQGPGRDTAAAYKKIQDALARIKSGEIFSKVAYELSDDKESANKGGELPGWITSGRVQRQIEDVFYSLKPGETHQEILTTPYGYFLIKTLQVEPRKQIKASHILVSFNGRDSLQAISKADSLLALLKGGAEFERLARENSDDESTAPKGGVLGSWYSRSTGEIGTGRTFLPQFEDAVFKLKTGEITGKVFTPYGVHIIRKDAERDADVTAEREEMRRLYKKAYFVEDKLIYLDSLRKAYKLVINEPVFNKFVSSLDTTKTNLDQKWSKDVPADLMNQTIYTFNGKPTTLGKFIERTNTERELRGFNTNREGMLTTLEKSADPEAIALATRDLEKKYPDFSSLLNEFCDGILLFKVEAMEVWDKLKFDSTAAMAFWEQNKSKYITDPQYEISEIYVTNDSLAGAIYAQLRNGADFASLAAANTQREGFREKNGSWGTLSPKKNGLAKKAQELGLLEGALTEPFPYEKGFSIIKIDRYEAPREKNFKEAIPDFAQAYQDMMQKRLSEEWLNKLRQQFKVTINEKEVNRIALK